MAEAHKIPYAGKMHPMLLEQLRQRARLEGRPVNEIMELALALILDAPFANRDLPEADVEICPSCQQAVLWERKCSHCGWRRQHERRWPGQDLSPYERRKRRRERRARNEAKRAARGG